MDYPLSEMRLRFDTKIDALPTKDNGLIFSKERYETFLTEVEDAKGKKQFKTRNDRRRLDRFEIIVENDIKKLICAKTHNKKIYYVNTTEYFDILHEAHTQCGHGKLVAMNNILKVKYKNIPKTVINIFVDFCEICQRTASTKRKGLVVKPLIFKDFNSRAQVDLIDLQTCPDGRFKYVMVYQDHFTKYLFLRALETKTAVEVANNLMDILILIGPPDELQSDNGREFKNRVSSSISEFWTGFKIVHGRPRHSQSQGSVERANRHIENILRSWIAESDSTKWSEGLKIIQFRKNNTFHSGINQSPHEALFGFRSCRGLHSSSIEKSIYSDIKDENQLKDAMKLVNHNIGTEDILNNQLNAILKNRSIARFYLEKQAKTMLKNSNQKFPPVAVGSTVRICIPEVDRNKGDLNNILAVVMTVSDNELYRLGCKSGILQGLYSKNQFTLCTETFLNIKNVPPNDISVRSANKQTSLVGGQGFKRCYCKSFCTTNKCCCKKNNLKCNSKCHSSMTCKNK